MPMTFIVLFEDDPGANPDIRTTWMAAHLAFLESNAGTIRAAGPLIDDDGRGAGGLWLLEATDEQAVERLVREDPFWSTGLRKSFRILRWRQVYADGARLIAPKS
jgi:uncharacterized protein